MRAVDLSSLRASDASLAWVLDAASDWLAFWKNKPGVEGFNHFDTLAVGYAISPPGFRCDKLHVGIEQRSDDTVTRPDIRLKPYLLVEQSLPRHQAALYCSEAQPSFHETLLKLLAKHEYFALAGVYYEGSR